MFKTIPFIFAAIFAFTSAAIAGNATQAFPADVYPSRTTAIRQLVAQLIQDLSEDPKFDAKNLSVQIAQTGISQPEIEELAIAPMRQAFPEMKVGSQSAHPLSIALSASDQTITLTADTKIYSAKFVEKPWADDWQMFVNKDSSHRWLNATSPSPAAGADEAVASARSAAKDPLLQLVQTELSARGARVAELRNKMTPDWLEQRITASLQRTQNDGILVKDTFIQKFSRPYGDVWQASVLIDASPKVIGQLADSYTSKAEKDFGNKAAGAAGILGMVAVLGLLYAFMNAVTKGYFMWRLRALAFLAAIAGILIVFSIV